MSSESSERPKPASVCLRSIPMGYSKQHSSSSFTARCIVQYVQHCVVNDLLVRERTRRESRLRHRCRQYSSCLWHEGTLFLLSDRNNSRVEIYMSIPLAVWFVQLPLLVVGFETGPRKEDLVNSLRRLASERHEMPIQQQR